MGEGRFPALTHLDLSENPIEGGGMEGFMAALTAERAPPLKKFGLYGTRMGDGGMTALAEAFRVGRLGFSI